jgi:hypothetical protein
LCSVTLSTAFLNRSRTSAAASFNAALSIACIDATGSIAAISVSSSPFA